MTTRLERLKDLEAKATPGEWKTTPGEYDSSLEGKKFQVNPMGLKDPSGQSVFSLDCGDFQGLNDSDTRLIAELRNAAKELIELVELADRFVQSRECYDCEETPDCSRCILADAIDKFQGGK